MDTGTRGELLAANMSVDEIREYLNVDSLSYLTLDRLLSATGAVGAGFCDACLTGNYPVAIPVELGKHILEMPSSAPTTTNALADALDVAPTLPAQDALSFSSEDTDG
jgi:amidophosphoribosyltransferase